MQRLEEDDLDGDELTTLNVQVDFVAAPVLGAPRPRLHTIPLPDSELRAQYAQTEPTAWPVQSATIPQPPPSVPSLTSLEVPNVETRRIDAETLAEVLARNTARAGWSTVAPIKRVVAKKPARWERRIGLTLLAVAVSMVTLVVVRPDLVAKSVTWMEAVVKVAKA